MVSYPGPAVERAMKLQEVILRAMAKTMTWQQAAEVIGITDRQMRRYRVRYALEGYDGLWDRRRGRPSPRRVALELAERVLGLCRERYFDLKVRHFHEKLRQEHGIGLSYRWVKAALQGAGLVRRGRQRGQHRRRRQRRPLPGMLLHIDGSRHRWFGDERWYDLIAILDDATGEIYYAQLVAQESTATVMAGLRAVVEAKGLFCALYSDRGSHFWLTPKAGGAVDKQRLTQVGRAMRELGIGMIPAYSPQARGRSERNFGTWQGRLPQELRLGPRVSRFLCKRMFLDNGEEHRELDNELIDKLLADYRGPEELVGEQGLLKQLTKRLVERAMQAELSHHLGYAKHDPAGRGSGNARNGVSAKTLKGDFGEAVIEVPRDRNGTFEPRIVGKHERRFTGFDDKILSMYARGMSTREIQGHLAEIYGVEVSPSLVSEVTDAVIEEVKAWQTRPLEVLYPILFLDALMVKMRHEGKVENRAVYVAIGIDLEGRKDVLGLWTSASEGAKFWRQVLTELRNRGIKDVFLACVDGLKGFPQAIEAVFPQAQVQLCIVHLVRASVNYVNWKERKLVARDLKAIYRAATAEQAERELREFGARWSGKYPTIAALWERHWAGVTPFFAFPAEIRQIVYTTNAVESLNMSLRKVLKTRAAFPREEAALKLLYLALRNLIAKWQQPQGWKAALNRFTMLWEDRITAAVRA